MLHLKIFSAALEYTVFWISYIVEKSSRLDSLFPISFPKKADLITHSIPFVKQIYLLHFIPIKLENIIAFCTHYMPILCIVLRTSHP